MHQRHAGPGSAARPRRRRTVAALAALLLAAAAVAGPRADDLERVRTEYVLKSAAFAPAARARALALIARIAPRADAMTQAEFLLDMLRIVALADNGHDALNSADGAWYPDARLPVRMLWFPEAWVIARADREHAELLGARVLRIEGHSPRALFARLRDLNGGIDAFRRWSLEYVVENAGLLHALGLARAPDRLTLELRLADGRRTRRTLAFVPKATLPPPQIFERVWSPAPWPGEAELGWRAFDPQPIPLYLGEGERLFRIARVPQLQALYLQMRAHFDMDGETVADFRSRVDAEIAAWQPRHLIVDLRFDTGGDSDLTRDWQRTLPARVPGRVYVLTGPYTFSAGIVAAAAFRSDAPKQVRLVGDAVGDRLHWWSEGENVCLANSHYCPHLTTGLWDLVHGCSGNPACYGDRYGVRVRDLNPDLAAPLTPESYLAGRDPAMEAVTRELADAPAPSAPAGGR